MSSRLAAVFFVFHPSCGSLSPHMICVLVTNPLIMCLRCRGLLLLPKTYTFSKEPCNMINS